MLAIHGVDCGKEAWLLEATPAVRLIAIDRLGFGESDDAPEAYGYEEVTADLEEFIMGLKLGELVVMGHG
jgi:pimeloyl-ACP methyl ester carboxylesterase